MLSLYLLLLINAPFQEVISNLTSCKVQEAALQLARKHRWPLILLLEALGRPPGCSLGLKATVELNHTLLRDGRDVDQS
jgi:hypothetical protein